MSITKTEQFYDDECRYIQGISNTKESVLANFMKLLLFSKSYYGSHILEKYLSHEKYPSFSNKGKYNLIMYSVYCESINHADEKIKNFECDCCQGVTELYKNAYYWLQDFETVKNQLRHANKNIIFKGDTMTSVFTPLKEYIKLRNNINETFSKTQWADYWIRNYSSLNISESACDFIWFGYSFANFIPVPQGFNRGRSNFGKWDSWDLTLTQIYQWYRDNSQTNNFSNDSALENLFTQNKEEAIEHCKKWLKMFYSWDDFVKQNYMESFLLPDGSPKKFFNNHTLEYGLPKTLDEYENFFKNAVSCIKERGNTLNKVLNME